MSTFKGNDFLLQAAETATGSAYSTIAALTATDASFSRALIDITNKDDAGWTSNIDSQRSITANFGGIYNGVSAQTVLWDMYNAATPWNCKLITGASAEGFTVEGAWQLQDFNHTGNVNERHDFTATLVSNGVMTITK